LPCSAATSALSRLLAACCCCTTCRVPGMVVRARAAAECLLWPDARAVCCTPTQGAHAHAPRPSRRACQRRSWPPPPRAAALPASAAPPCACHSPSAVWCVGARQEGAL
jgi:hypothetical protein